MRGLEPAPERSEDPKLKEELASLMKERDQIITREIALTQRIRELMEEVK